MSIPERGPGREQRKPENRSTAERSRERGPPRAPRGAAAATRRLPHHRPEGEGDRGELHRPVRRPRRLARAFPPRSAHRHVDPCSLWTVCRRDRRLRHLPGGVLSLDLGDARARPAGAAHCPPLPFARRSAPRGRRARRQYRRAGAFAGAVRGGDRPSGRGGGPSRPAGSAAAAEAPALAGACFRAAGARLRARAARAGRCGQRLAAVSRAVATRGALHLCQDRQAPGDGRYPPWRAGRARRPSRCGHGVATGPGTGPDRWRGEDRGGP